MNKVLKKMLTNRKIRSATALQTLAILVGAGTMGQW